MNRKILNLDGTPFLDFEQAAKMRDLLLQENPGQAYRVELFDADNAGMGFVVERQMNESTMDSLRLSPDSTGSIHSMSNPDSHQGSVNENDVRRHQDELIAQPEDGVQPKTYHPALRTYLLYLPLILAGLLVMLFATEIWVAVFQTLGISQLPNWMNGHVLISGLQFLAGIWVFWLVSGVLLNYYGTALIVDEHGVTLKKGIIARDVINVRFNEIRTIGLKQGILERLLGIGSLEFASSGTDDMDIRFFNIVNPGRVKAEIEDIIRQYRH